MIKYFYLLLAFFMLSIDSISQVNSDYPTYPSPPISYSVNSSSYVSGFNDSDLAWADYDNDGDQDLIVSGKWSIVLFKNENSQLNIVKNAPFPGINDGAVAWADYDNDGDQDLMIIGDTSTLDPIAKLYQYDSEMDEFHEVFAGVFKPVGDGSIAWADYDNDGDQDLMISGQEDYFEPSCILYENNSGTGFTEVKNTPFLGVYEGAIAWADYDNDGDQDVMTVGVYEGYVYYPTFEFVNEFVAYLYKNNGDKSFTKVENTPFQGVRLGDLAWADYDNDGDQDVMIQGNAMNSPENVGSLYQYDLEAGTFTEVFAGTFIGLYESSISWADYDNDGYEDVLIAGGNNGMQTYLFKNNSGNSFTEVENTPFPDFYRGDAAWADYDNDGDQDLYIACNDGNLLFRNDEEGFTSIGQEYYFWPVAFGDMAWVDYDNDGDQDVMVSGNQKTRLYNYDRDQNTFTEVFENTFINVNVSSVAWGDYDNDGDQDVVVTGNRYGPNIKLYQNYNGSGFTEVENTGLPPVYYSEVQWCDYDNDGWLELFIAGWNGPEDIAHIYEYIPDNQSFSKVENTPFRGIQRGDAAWGDYDNDGDQDVIITGYQNGHTFVTDLYKNNDGTFIQVKNTPFAQDISEFGAVAWGDYDEDGDLDLMIVTKSAKLYQYNHLDDTFSEVTNQPFKAVAGSEIAWVDYDNDGDLDVMLSSSSSSSLYANSNGSFTVVENTPFMNVSQGTIEWIDYDLDQDQDLFLTGSWNGISLSELYTADLQKLDVFSPAKGAQNVDADTDLTFTLDKNLQKGTGSIIIKRSDDDSVFEVIDITSEQVDINQATVTVNPINTLSEGGSFYVEVDSGAVIDLEGKAFSGINNKNEWNFSTTDTNAPIPTLLDSGYNIGSDLLKVFVQFNEKIKGFDKSDVTVINGSVSSLTTSDSTLFDIILIPDQEGIVIIDIDKNVANDQAGNGNVASLQKRIVYDITAPTLKFHSNVKGAVNEIFRVNVVLSEVVQDFEVDNIFVDNGTIANFERVDSINFWIDVIPKNEGKITLSVADNTIFDKVGNGNLAENYNKVYDKTSPVAIVSDDESFSINEPSWNVKVLFEEVVQGFELADILVQNAEVSDLNTSDSINFTLKVVPIKEGLVKLHIPSEVVQDLAGNKNEPSVLYEVSYDVTLPSVDLNSSDTIFNTSAISISLVYSEKVKEFSLNDIRLTNGIVTSLQTSDSISYRLEVTPIEAGKIEVSVPENLMTDEAGNYNRVSNTLELFYDNILPTLSFSTTENDTTYNSFELDILFSEVVNGFTIDDLQVTNASVADFLSVDSTSFTVQVYPLSKGQITVQVPSGSAEDLAGNINEASEVFNLIYDEKISDIDTLFALTLDILTNSQTKLPAYKVSLYQRVEGQYKLITVQESNGSSSLTFDNIVEGEYTVGIQADGTSFLTTYLGNSITLFGAETFILAQDTYQQVNLISKLGPSLKGESVITGTLISDTNANNSRILSISNTYSGTPIEAVVVYLLQPDTREVIAHSITDEHGNFSFLNLKQGEYLFVADYEGLSFDEEDNLIQVSTDSETVTITVIVADSIRVTNINTEKHVTATTKKVYATNTSLYPNPVIDYVSIDLDPFWLYGQIIIRDYSAKLLSLVDITSMSTELNMKTLKPGVYLITISKGEEHQTFKVYKK